MSSKCHNKHYFKKTFSFWFNFVCLPLVSYQVLARKYRPQTFDQVVGQEPIIRTLRNAIETRRIPHAFLFVGPRGIGKTSTARILAKALNCTDGPKANFDPEDEICREISEGRSMDVLEIDGASNNGVEQVRDLRDNVQYAPTRGHFKIYVIDEVHMLSTAAFNALLKTLEEPPAHVKFIFATTEVHKLPATILSRCQRFDLKRISDDAIFGHLGFICQKEEITVEPTALKILARNAEGGLRDAESALEQLISFCGKNIKASDVLEVFGLTGPEEVWALAEAIQAGNTTVCLEQVRSLLKSGKDSERLAKELLRYFRNLLVFVLSPEAGKEQLDEEDLKHFGNLQPLPSQEHVLAFIEELIRLEEKLRFALVKDVTFEIAMLRMAQQRRKVSLEEILRCLTSGEEIPATIEAASPPTTPSQPKPPAQEPHPVSPPPVDTETKSTATTTPKIERTPEEVWTIATAHLKKKDIAIRRFLESCTYCGYEQPAILAKMIAQRALYDIFLKSDKYKDLTNLLKRGLGPSTELRLAFEPREEEIEDSEALIDPEETNVSNSPPKSTAAPQESKLPGQMTKEEFENDPLVKQALEAFDARIVEVKS